MLTPQLFQSTRWCCWIPGGRRSTWEWRWARWSPSSSSSLRSSYSSCTRITGAAQTPLTPSTATSSPTCPSLALLGPKHGRRSHSRAHHANCRQPLVTTTMESHPWSIVAPSCTPIRDSSSRYHTNSSSMLWQTGAVCSPPRQVPWQAGEAAQW